MYQVKQTCHLKEPKTLQSHLDFVSHRGTAELKQGGVFENLLGICLVGTGPNDPTERRMILEAEVQREAI